MAILFLCQRVRVVPVCSVLTDAKAVGESFAGLNAVKAVKAGYTIHLAWQQQAMPMHRADLFHVVGDMNNGFIPFIKFQRRPGNASIDGNALQWFAGDMHYFFSKHQCIFLRFSKGCGR